MSKLWAVTVEARFDIPVVAETEEDAIAEAMDHIHDELENCDRFDSYGAEEIKSKRDLSSELAGCYPWGGDGKKKVEEYLE